MGGGGGVTFNAVDLRPDLSTGFAGKNIPQETANKRVKAIQWLVRQHRALLALQKH